MPAGPTFEPGGGGSAQSARLFNEETSLMQRAGSDQRRAQMEQMKIAEEIAMGPVRRAQSAADLQKAKSEYDGAIETENARRGAYRMADDARENFNWALSILNAKSRADAMTEWLSRYSQIENVKELSAEFKRNNEIATKVILQSKGIEGLTAGEREFNSMTEGFSPDEKGKAQRVEAGIEGRASGIPNQNVTANLPDGRQVNMVFDRSTGQYRIPDIAPSVGGEADPTKNPLRGATPGEETGQKVEAERVGALKAAKPKRESGLRSLEAANDQLTKDIDGLIGRVGMDTAGPVGVASAIVPGTPAYGFKAELDGVLGRIASQALVAMRLASPTGGALGNVSDRDIRLLENMAGAVKQGMGPEELKSALVRIKERLGDATENQREFFKSEYPEGGTVPASIRDLSDEALERRKQQLQGAP